MELLQQILEGMVAGFRTMVDILSPLIASLVSAVFDVEVSAEAAQGFTTVLLILFGAWAVGKAFNGVTKSPASQPMKVEHFTTKTPAQVVSEDRWGKVKTLLIIGAVLLVFYFLGDVAAS